MKIYNMRNSLSFLYFNILLINIQPNSYAQNVAVPSILKNNNCVTCHSSNQTLLGPSWKDISAKYKNDKNGLDIINSSISKGSSNKWGEMPMPASPQINAAQINELSKWILQH